MDWKIVVGTFIRQALTGVAAVLVANGIIEPGMVDGLLDHTTALIVGGVTALVAYVWSLVSKKKALDAEPK